MRELDRDLRRFGDLEREKNKHNESTHMQEIKHNAAQTTDQIKINLITSSLGVTVDHVSLPPGMTGPSPLKTPEAAWNVKLVKKQMRFLLISQGVTPLPIADGERCEGEIPLRNLVAQ